jgi:hypothetical protein
MKRNAGTSPLDSIRIASPCPVRWEDMPGDERVRACAVCGLHVYNLSAMPRAAAESLVREKEGRLCVRLYRREDGRVMVQDCLMPVRAAARFVALRTIGLALGLSGALAGAAAAISGIGALSIPSRGRSPAEFLEDLTDWEPARTVVGWLMPRRGSVTVGRMITPSQRCGTETDTGVDTEGSSTAER